MPFTKVIARGGVWFLFAFLMAMHASARAEVIDFQGYRLRKSCSKLLLSGESPPRGPAKILEFRPLIAPQQSWESFRAEMNGSGSNQRYHYFYFGGYGNKAPFSVYDEGAWMSQSSVPPGAFLYILKASPKWAERPETTGQVAWNIRALRRSFELVSYTKVPVPPLIRILEQAIHHTRMMESNLANQPYHAQRLPYDALLRQESFLQAALDFIDLWQATNPHEEDIKWFMKDLVLRERPKAAHTDRAVKIKKALHEKLESLYRNSPY